MRQCSFRKQATAYIFVALLSLLFDIQPVLSLAPPAVKGSAAKPYEKQKVAVFGAGGYLGACIYGFLQRAGSLYGTGIAGIGAPRAISATGVGSQNLNGVLGKNFILAQADESFVKLTDMNSPESIRLRLKGFDAAIMATRYTLETRPVTGGTYEKTPNDKTLEFYMDRPRSSTVQGMDDPDYSANMLKKSLEACREEGVKRVVVIETDSCFDDPSASGSAQYLDLLEQCGVPYVYIQPAAALENFPDYTYAKGVQANLNVQLVEVGNIGSVTRGGSLYREDLAALCVQSLLSLDWKENKILRVSSNGPAAPSDSSTKPPNQQWCVNSDSILAFTLAKFT
mmetsp:Transcript_44539/g.128755  ORF Transcript_44539/g.128755 Transcript_44539/m.128755 type:complete len:340 (-) Transcript_44539:8-1027(-)